MISAKKTCAITGAAFLHKSLTTGWIASAPDVWNTEEAEEAEEELNSTLLGVKLLRGLTQRGLCARVACVLVCARACVLVCACVFVLTENVRT